MKDEHGRRKVHFTQCLQGFWAGWGREKRRGARGSPPTKRQLPRPSLDHLAHLDTPERGNAHSISVKRLCLVQEMAFIVIVAGIIVAFQMFFITPILWYEMRDFCIWCQ